MMADTKPEGVDCHTTWQRVFFYLSDLIDPGTFYIGITFTYSVESYYSVTIPSEHIVFLDIVEASDTHSSYVLLYYATSNKIVVLYSYTDGNPIY